MRFNLLDLTGSASRLEAAAKHFDEEGFLVLDGLEDTVTPLFTPMLARAIGIADTEMKEFLDPFSAPVVLPEAVRQNLSRIDTTPELAESLLATLGPVLMRLVGPALHVSSNFHAQVKGGDAVAVAQGGGVQGYKEVQGQYLIHQDFTGARIPTSPAQITLWVAQNTSPDWNLDLYPGSHRHGMLCNQWVPLEDPWLQQFGTPVSIPAKYGSAVIFNSLVLHSSGKGGPCRRVSCDIRFFPLCGFLPSKPYILGKRPIGALREQLANTTGPTLRAPLLETLAYLGEDVLDPDVPEHSILNWANYLTLYLRRDADGARPWLERFVNTERGLDTPDIYTAKFHNQPIHLETLEHAKRAISALESDEANLPEMDRLLGRLRETSRGAPTVTA
ncbi:MAG: phytanoyl-CoA dioxygenase family protein [Anaerolineae bacterium]|nr:phytanoyl-CoA dioxygenase family protein [Gemmatimonadaceae bacterium]